MQIEIFIIIGTIILLAIIASIVVWVVGLYQVISRNDLKESKALWIVLMIILGTIGTIAYGFVENKKKLARWALLSTVLVIILPLFAFLYVFWLAPAK